MKVLLSEAIWDFDLDAALCELSEQRREQALKFRHEQGRRLCVLAYRLLQQGLREQYGITEPPLFEYNAHGKPSIVGHPEICFNLSHCKYAAACVIDSHPVGIDIEGIRAYKESLARYTMNDEELRQILSSDNPDVTFTRLWTIKEAALKLLGTGITNDLKTILSPDEDDLSSPRFNFDTVASATLPYIYTVATRVNNYPIRR